METKKHGRGKPVTVWLPDDLDAQIDQILARQVAEAAAAGQFRRLPSRHALMLEALRGGIAAQSAQ